MTFFSRSSLSTGLATVAAAASFAVLAPAAANADAIDDALNALPAGQITCEQAENYWTNTADYNEKVAMAQMVARFDSRGAEINAALARVDEAATRCGLKGDSPAPGNPAPAPNEGNPAAPQNQGIQGAPTITIPTAPGTPTITIPAFNTVNLVLPGLLRIVQDFLVQWGINIDLGQFLR